MEQIQNHEIMDTWRLEEGIIVQIYKFEHMGWIGFADYKTKIVRGCKGLKQLKEDYKGFKTGDLIYGSSIIKAIDDETKFRAELKLSGGAVKHSIEGMLKLNKNIESILKSYCK